jgi:hypothetical protein
VERHVRAWAPLRLRLRPGTARRIAEAADEIRSLWLERRDAHEPSRPAQPAPLAGFATSARRHFDFLLEHGFEVASENEASVSYRRGDVGIVVLLHDEFGFPFVKLHRLVDGRWPQAEEALLPALVPPGPAEAARRERLAPDADPETQLAADAGILKRWGGSLLDGDPSAIGAARDRERARPQLVDDVGKALVEHGLARERLGPAMSMVEKLERLRESGQTPAAADVYAQLPSHLRLRARLNPAERRRLRAAAAEIERLWSTYVEATAAGVTGT